MEVDSTANDGPCLTLVTQQRTWSNSNSWSDEAQRTAALGEQGCWNLDVSTTAYTSSHFLTYGFVTRLWDDRGLAARDRTMMKNI